LHNADNMPTRIFLTGASGYIGLHILRELLAAGHLVTAVVRARYKLCELGTHPSLQVIEADLEDSVRIANELPGHQICIHAALIWGDPGSELEARDVAITAKLFDSCAIAGISRCIYLSSAAVHRPFSGEMSEDDGLSASDLYGATKAAGELFLRASCASRQMTGVVVRPGPVIGPPAFPDGAFRSDDRIVQMVATAMRNQRIETPTDHGRQFTDVTALARTVRRLATLETPLPIYICVDREITTWERIARTAVKVLSSASEVHVRTPDTPDPPPRFRTERIAQLNGGPLTSGDALVAHITHIFRMLDASK